MFPFPTKTYIACPCSRNINMPYPFTERVVYRNTSATEINIPAIVQGNPVGPLCYKKCFSRQHTVSADVVTVGFVTQDVCDVQSSSIPRSYDSIRLQNIAVHDFSLSCILWQVIYILLFYIGTLACPVASLIIWIGKINTAFFIYPQIVRAVQFLIMEKRKQHSN